MHVVSRISVIVWFSLSGYLLQKFMPKTKNDLEIILSSFSFYCGQEMSQNFLLRFILY